MSATITAFNRTRGTSIAEHVRIASTHWSRMRGLIGASQFNFRAGHALWIIPCHGVHTLGMRFPLDLIYMDHFGVAVTVQTQLKPWRLASIQLRAASVLELPVGTIQRTNTAVGDQIEILAANTPEEMAA